MTEQDIEQLIESCRVLQPADRAHLDAIRDEADADLALWCARRRRAADLRRFAVAACLAVAVVVVSGRVWAMDSVALQVESTADATDMQVCDKVYQILNRQ